MWKLFRFILISVMTLSVIVVILNLTLINQINQSLVILKVQSSSKLTLKVDFIEGADPEDFHGPAQAQRATEEALLSFASNGTKCGYGIPVPSYRKNQNISNTLSSIDLDLDLKFNVIDNLSQFDLIYMTAVFTPISRTVLQLTREDTNNVVVIVGPNVYDNDVRKMTQIANQFFVANRNVPFLGGLQYGYLPNPLGNELMGIASEMRHSDYRSRSACITYVKADAAVEPFVIQLGETLNCTLFRYGHYEREELLLGTRQAKFVIISDVKETQGFAFMEILSYNVPMLIVDMDETHFVRHKSSKVFPYFDRQRCGHLCFINSTVTTVKQELSDCFATFLSKVENTQYDPAQFALDEFNQCDFVNTLLDFSYAMQKEIKELNN